MNYSLPEYLRVQNNMPLADYSTIGIGGPARYFIEVDSIDALSAALEWGSGQALPVFVLGGGSNILCSDEGFPGLVIRLAMRGIDYLPSAAGRVLVTAAAGEVWDDLVAATVDRNLQGIECLSGIPGSVGASPVQNIGAYGQEVMDTITSVEALDRETGTIRTFKNEECGFSYRMSRFKGTDKDRYIITQVTFELTRNAPPAIRYGDLTRYFSEQQMEHPSLRQVREAVITIRGRKAMVLDPAEPNSRSCGSFFMNPIVSAELYQQVLHRVAEQGLLKPDEKMPAFDAGEGRFKLSAAWLMERAGLKRGQQHGNVGLSERHVLAIVNRGGGTCREVLQLVELVKLQVQNAFGVTLEPEPVFIGH